MHCIGRQTVEQTLSLFGSSVVQYAIFWYLVLQSNSGMVMTGAMVAAAVRQVTDSKAAKEQADAEAAAQAQAQAAAAAAQSQRSYSQSYNRYGGSSRGYSSNRGYSAPQQSYTPSSNGGSHRTFDFSNSGSNGGPNTCGSTCGLIER